MKKKIITISLTCLLCSTLFTSGQTKQNDNMKMKINPSTYDIFGLSKGNILEYQPNQIRHDYSIDKSINQEEGQKIATIEAYGEYQPNQIKHAYGIDKLINQGEGQKIAIIEAYGSDTIENDFDIFNKKYGLQATNLSVFYPNGKPNISDINWAKETSLDVEWVHALAPKAEVQLIISKSESIDDLMEAVDFASKIDANVVTMSWGEPEFLNELNYDSHFSNKNVTYIASAGDNGAGTEWPAVCPNVLAVGGTTLVLDSKGELIQPETAWTGSGGGISKYESEPAFQKNYGVKSNNHRAIPDVSFSANQKYGVSVYSDATGWFIDGGTSFAASAWSAFVALVKQNKTNSFNIQESLYEIAASKKYTSSFIDITSGNNGTGDMNNAHVGYDFVTGLGSPIENLLYNNMIK